MIGAGAAQVAIPWGCWSQQSDLVLPFCPLHSSGQRYAGAPACSTQALADAIRAPIELKASSRLAAGARTAVIAVDDITRPTPLATALGLIVAEMAAIPSENIRILVALGAHRPMVRAELEQKLGPGVLDRIRRRTAPSL